MELGRLQNSDGLLSDEDSEADEFVPLVTLFSSDDGLDKDNFEPDPIGLAPGIMMHNLKKVGEMAKVSGCFHPSSCN